MLFVPPRMWRIATPQTPPVEQLIHTGTHGHCTSAAEVNGVAARLGLTSFSLVMFLRVQRAFTGVIQTIIKLCTPLVKRASEGQFFSSRVCSSLLLQGFSSETTCRAVKCSSPSKFNLECRGSGKVSLGQILSGTVF